MAVMSLRGLVAVAVWLPAVSAGMEREKPNLWAPIETSVHKPQAEIELVEMPAVTARPVVRAALEKRNPNTCGYINGSKGNGYECRDPAAVCLVNTIVSAVGCCWTTDCNIWTACLPYVSSDARSTLDMDRTRYCSESTKPFCVPLMYTDAIFSGYTIPSCGSVETTVFISYSSSVESSTSTTTTSSLVLTTESSSTESESSSTTESESQTESETQSPTQGGSNNQNPPVESSSSTPIGPIVGGVVGGVAVLALIGFGIFLLMRKKNKGDAPAAAAPPAGFSPQGPPPANPNGYPPMSPSDMSSPGGAAAGFFDPRYSIAKPAGASTVDPMQPQPSPFPVSPSQSPPPMYPQQHNPQMGAPPPHMAMATTPPPQMQHQQYQQMGPTPPPQGLGTPPPQQQGAYGYQGQQQHHAAELPTQRGDGQLYEAP